MFEIKPHLEPKITCPHCHSHQISHFGVNCVGIQWLIEAKCQTCNLEFYHTLPSGHAWLFPWAFAKNEPRAFLPAQVGNWYYQYLLDAYYKPKFLDCKVQKISYKEFDNVLIINCVDYLFGHSFLRLLNVERHLKTKPELGVIVIAPRALAWLIPDGVAEVWLVEVNFADCKQWLVGLNDFFQRFTKIYLSYTFVQLDWRKVDISLFTRTNRFDLAQFVEKPPQITFVLREDRFWLRNWFEKSLFRVSIRFKLQKYFKLFFCFQQNRRFARLAKRLKRQNPALKIYAVGLGKSLKISRLIDDNRTKLLNPDLELNWCELYSHSHLVVGVHGSNMLIPTALSAGFIELLPNERISNFAEDIALPYDDRKLYFFGRFLPETASTALVAQHIEAIFQGFRLFQLHLKNEP
jgi:hypothetical protein